MRRGSDSVPWRSSHALMGEMQAPVSRSMTARMRVTKAVAPATWAKMAPWYEGSGLVRVG